MIDRVLVVFVDAFGPELARRMESLARFAPHTAALSGVLGYSCGALPTVLTGKPPSAHGRMCLFSAREGREPGLLSPLGWLGLLPRVVHERAAVRRAAGSLFARARGLTGYVALHRVPPSEFAWLDLPEREDLFEARSIGGEATFLADAREAGLSVYAAPWRLGEDERWQHALAELGARPPHLAFLYSAELDGILHREGSSGPSVEGAAKRLEARIEQAASLMSRGGEVTTLVVGDHGMADVRRVVDPRPLLARLSGVRPFVDSTMLRLWGEPSAIDRARRRIADEGLGGRTLLRPDLDARRAPPGGRFGDAIHVLDEGSLFAPSFLGGAVRGMHGYDLGSASSVAALASSRPIPSGTTSLTDLAGLVRAELGLGSHRKGAAA